MSTAAPTVPDSGAYPPLTLRGIIGFGPGGVTTGCGGLFGASVAARLAGAFRALCVAVLALAAVGELYQSPQAGWRMALVYAALAVILSYVGTACIARNTLQRRD